MEIAITRGEAVDEQSALVTQVNDLIKQSFGKGFQANFEVSAKNSSDGDLNLNETDHLHLIGRRYLRRVRKYIPFLSVLAVDECVGKISADGSHMEVFENFTDKAERFKELYKNQTGREISITPCDNYINPFAAL